MKRGGKLFTVRCCWMRASLTLLDREAKTRRKQLRRPTQRQWLNLGGGGLGLLAHAVLWFCIRSARPESTAPRAGTCDRGYYGSDTCVVPANSPSNDPPGRERGTRLSDRKDQLARFPHASLHWLNTNSLPVKCKRLLSSRQPALCAPSPAPAQWPCAGILLPRGRFSSRFAANGALA